MKLEEKAKIGKWLSAGFGFERGIRESEKLRTMKKGPEGPLGERTGG